ncbi:MULTISPECIES: hypothetical protein [unclassified Coleofasciculus]|uniref:hypothetical protein n=1 Tax=unclassified Coleofasciculus TaxID=2692782 RepID=UPI0018805648|nr:MULTISPECIES: hypothetical protein [unclassified Coleofasciculus]MBE9128166.1 hypothetical protein [Coleofasciculus sp. LEGE 07081]MBE9149733.1 hypothetical protein [Coleofasciculus sp. LEGE 07092]
MLKWFLLISASLIVSVGAILTAYISGDGWLKPEKFTVPNSTSNQDEVSSHPFG